jgi:Mg-chelatase subunit ChlD
LSVVAYQSWEGIRIDGRGIEPDATAKRTMQTARRPEYRAEDIRRPTCRPRRAQGTAQNGIVLAAAGVIRTKRSIDLSTGIAYGIVRDAYEERDAKNIIFILPDEVSHTISQGANRSDEIHVIPVVVAADGNLNRPIQAIVEKHIPQKGHQHDTRLRCAARRK